MDEFIYHFETLVKERKGHILDFEENPTFAYSCAVLPYQALIRKQDTLRGGIAIKSNGKKVSLATYFQRESCKYGILKPLALSLFKCHFHPYELELFVIDLFSQIDYLKLFEVEEAAIKFKEAKAGSNPIELRILSQLVNQIIPNPHTLDILKQYVQEEDQKGLNPLGKYGRRVRRTPILDRFDAANAIAAYAGDIQNPETKWDLMELAGQILWEIKSIASVYKPHNEISALFKDRNSFFNKD